MRQTDFVLFLKRKLPECQNKFQPISPMIKKSTAMWCDRNEQLRCTKTILNNNRINHTLDLKASLSLHSLTRLATNCAAQNSPLRKTCFTVIAAYFKTFQVFFFALAEFLHSQLIPICCGSSVLFNSQCIYLIITIETS